MGIWGSGLQFKVLDEMYSCGCKPWYTPLAPSGCCCCLCCWFFTRSYPYPGTDPVLPGLQCHRFYPCLFLLQLPHMDAQSVSLERNHGLSNPWAFVPSQSVHQIFTCAAPLGPLAIYGAHQNLTQVFLHAHVGNSYLTAWPSLGALQGLCSYLKITSLCISSV